jgi:hypothetical protein
MNAQELKAKNEAEAREQIALCCGEKAKREGPRLEAIRHEFTRHDWRTKRRKPVESLESPDDDPLEVLIKAETEALEGVGDDGAQPEPGSDAFSVLETSVREVRALKELEASAVEAEVEAARHQVEAARRRAIYTRLRAEYDARVARYFEADKLARLPGLTPRELEVVHARIGLIQQGLPDTHDDVGQLLVRPVKAATASKLWKRAQAKLAKQAKTASADADVSTRADACLSARTLVEAL